MPYGELAALEADLKQARRTLDIRNRIQDEIIDRGIDGIAAAVEHALTSSRPRA